MTRRNFDQHCPIAEALDVVGERWSLLIVRELLLGPKRYTDLRRALPRMWTNLLVDRLRHRMLATIVVDLHPVELLQIVEVIKKEVDHIPTHPLGEVLSIRELTLPVREGLVADGEVSEQDAKRRKKPQPIWPRH